MKTYIDVVVKSNYQRDEELIEVIRRFTDETEGWKYLVEQSQEYSSATGEASCIILREDNQYHPAVALTKKKSNTFFVSNIVPKEVGHIVMSEYNQIANKFAVGLRNYAKKNHAKLRVVVTSDKVDLEQIISGNVVRGFFERYLRLFPTSYHPADIERLDTFICAVFRYSKKHIDLDLLKGWLMEKKKWSERDAKWCVQRIETGLAILKANRKF